MDLNKAQVIGNVTQDIEVKETANGKKVCSFSIATNRKWTTESGEKKEEAEFHNIVLWGKVAEIAGQYVKKGDKLFMEGRLQTRSWEGDDGVKKYRTEIVGENMLMLGNKKDGNTSVTANDTASSIAKAPANKTAPKEEEISVEDIPF